MRTEAERRLFRDLLKVTGVGARIALAILSGISVDGFVRCVLARDTATLTKVPGVGRRTAERLILDLRDRIDEMAAQGIGAAPAQAGAAGPATAQGEVLDALLALGYRPARGPAHGGAGGSGQRRLDRGIVAGGPARRSPAGPWLNGMIRSCSL